MAPSKVKEVGDEVKEKTEPVVRKAGSAARRTSRPSTRLP